MSESPSVAMRRLTGEEALPGAYARFLAGLEQAGNPYGLEWIDNFRCRRVLPGSQFRLYALEDATRGEPLLCMPAVYSRLYAAHPRARVVHFLQPDGEAYAPIPARAGAERSCVPMLFAFLEAERPRCDVLRFTPLDPGSGFAGELLAALRRARWPRRVERLPPERYLEVGGRTHARLMAARPPALRAALEAAARSLLDTGRAAFRLIHATEDVTRAWEDYREILGEDWPDLEGDAPEYLEGVMRAAAGKGALRVGFLDLDGAPTSVQVWRLAGGGARCLRIWSHPERRAAGLNDLLTAHMTRHLVDDAGAGVLYFGAVNEAFGSNWAPSSSPRLDVMAFNARTRRGVTGAIRHVSVACLRAAWRLARRALPG